MKTNPDIVKIIQTAAKWDELALFLSTLTVIVNKNKYSANNESMLHIAEKIATMSELTETWYEDWGSFLTTRFELRKVRAIRSELKKLKIEELFG